MATAATYQRGVLPLWSYFRTQSRRTGTARKPLFQAFLAHFASRDTEWLCIKFATTIDPAVESGTLLMNVANRIGVDKCTVYSQDIS